jgi:sugar phosphate isomerase/epimerase
VSIDPRIVVNYTSLAPDTPVDEGLSIIAASGVRRFGIARHQLGDTSADQLTSAARAHGLELTYLIQRSLFHVDDPVRLEADRLFACETLQMAADAGAELVYATTGPLGALEPEHAVTRFADAVQPILERARSLGLRLYVETTNPLYADIDFLHTLRDTVRTAQATGVGVVVDLHPTWTEFGLTELLAQFAAEAGMVQISDYIPGTRELTRSIPGDGVIPLRRHLRTMLDAGFQGWFDLEIAGLGRGDGTDAAELRRSAQYVTAVLEEIRS